MALRYDFDMVSVTPAGVPDPSGARQVAMFRDPQVIDALGRADPVVRTFLVESGFAMHSFDSGAPPGRFALRDEAARIGVIEKLSANLATHDLKGVDWGGFDFQAFMQALSVAEPVDDALLAPRPASHQQDLELAAARAASRQRQGRRMIALGGLLVGLILLIYVAIQLIG